MGMIGFIKKFVNSDFSEPLNKKIDKGTAKSTEAATSAANVEGRLTDARATNLDKIPNINISTANVEGRLTSTRAGHLDSIPTINANAKTILTNTNTNNTGSETGTLSQKLSSILGYLKNTTYGLANLKTLLDKKDAAPLASWSFTSSLNETINVTAGASAVTLLRFVVPRDGLYRIYIARESATQNDATVRLDVCKKSNSNITTVSLDTVVYGNAYIKTLQTDFYIYAYLRSSYVYVITGQGYNGTYTSTFKQVEILSAIENSVYGGTKPRKV